MCEFSIIDIRRRNKTDKKFYFSSISPVFIKKNKVYAYLK